MPTPDIPDVPLPTLARLGHTADFAASTLPIIDALAIARDWLSSFQQAICAPKPSKETLSPLLFADGFWRDMLALTWDFRTFRGRDVIAKFVEERIGDDKEVQIRNVALRKPSVMLQKPFEDLVWIQLMFDFEIGTVGRGMAIVRLVPVASSNSKNIDWQAHVIFTNLEGLISHPEKVGPLRSFEPNHGKWEAARAEEINFTPGVIPPPQVIVIGGGQSGLETAARLKMLGVSSLVVERNKRIGDNWRNRYEALCLHDPVWYDHMPYLPFPPSWPVYTPSQKLANWLEHYAEILELNVWTSANITSVTQDEQSGKWDVVVKREDGEERKFTVNHVVFATGLGSGVPNTPSYPGMDKFKGQILHSSEHNRALDHAGKKVVIVGACTSAHDIASDYYHNDVDVTMFQRGSTYIMSVEKGWPVIMGSVYWEGAPPVDIADRLNASFPHHMATELNQRRTKYIAKLDNDLIQSLHKVGFRTNLGIKDTGFGLLAWSKAGGYYLDTGTSQLIADGKIKLKTDSEIGNFDETGIVFQNGTRLDADVVVFATGLGDPRVQVERIFGTEIGKKCNPIWGLNEEGELNGVWRDLGVKGLWYMMGNLALCRFHSSHVSLQIKAMEEGVFGTRYSS